MKFLLPLVSLAVALAGLYLINFHAKKIDKAELLTPGYLAKFLPEKFAGATSVEKPLGDTEEVARAAKNLLIVSDYLNREYTLSNGDKVSVYVAYWTKAKETLERATTHTPDRCWVRNGWACNKQTRTTNKVVNVGGKTLKPAVYGEYSISAGNSKITRHVWYWFLADGQVYKFSGENYVPNPFVWLKNAVMATVKETPEMYFIRIDSAKPLDELLGNPEFARILECLGKMILFNDNPAPENAGQK